MEGNKDNSEGVPIIEEEEKKPISGGMTKKETMNKLEGIFASGINLINNPMTGVKRIQKKETNEISNEQIIDNNVSNVENVESVVESIKEEIKESEIKIMKMQTRKNVHKPKGRKSITKKGNENVEDKKTIENQEIIQNISQDTPSDSIISQQNGQEIIQLENDIILLKKENEEKKKRIEEQIQLKKRMEEEQIDLSKNNERINEEIQKLMKNISDKQENINQILNELNDIKSKDKIDVNKELLSFEELESCIKEENERNEQMVLSIKESEEYFIKETEKLKKLIQNESEKRKEEKRKEEINEQTLIDLESNNKIVDLKEIELIKINSDKKKEKDDLEKEIKQLQSDFDLKKKENDNVEKELELKQKNQQDLKDLEEMHKRNEETIRKLKGVVMDFKDKKWLCFMKEEEQMAVLATIVLQFKLSHPKNYEKSVPQIFEEIQSKKVPIGEWRKYVNSLFDN